jgi:hypothetical protein
MSAVDNYPQADGLIGERGVWSFKPGAAISKGQTVYISAADTVSPVATGYEDKVIGVALEDASAANTPAKISVALKGSGKVVKVIGNGTVTAGKLCIAANGGKVADWPTSPAIGDVPKVVGKALQSASVDGDEILVVLC